MIRPPRRKGSLWCALVVFSCAWLYLVKSGVLGVQTSGLDNRLMRIAGFATDSHSRPLGNDKAPTSRISKGDFRSAVVTSMSSWPS